MAGVSPDGMVEIEGARVDSPDDALDMVPIQRVRYVCSAKANKARWKQAARRLTFAGAIADVPLRPAGGDALREYQPKKKCVIQ